MEEEIEEIEDSSHQKTDNTLLMVLLSIVLLAVGVLAINWLMATKPEAKKAPLEVWTPNVKVIPLLEKDYTPVIHAEGEVEAATRTMLISEVAGAVTYISPLLEKGNIINEGDVILRVDDSDYKTTLTSTRSTLADAELMLAQEEARALQAARDWKKLGRGNKPTDLVLRKPQIKSARARIDAAQAALKKAERDMAKTTIRAPYTCMVDQKFFDAGAYVSMMGQIAEVSSLNEYEVRLPLNLNEVGYLGSDMGVGKEVLLEASIGGEFYQWKGTAVRFEGGVDSSTFSMVMVVSLKRDLTMDNVMFQLPPVGMFVKAKLKGENMGKVLAIPREALREGNTVWILTDENVLEIVPVKVILSERDQIIISSDKRRQLSSGERVIISPIAIPVNGMKLEVESQDPPENEGEINEGKING